MTTIADVRDELSRVIHAATGLRALPYDSMTLPHPCAVVTLDEFDPRLVLGLSKSVYPFRVTVYLGLASEKAAQKRCDEIREIDGPRSILGAVKDDTAWQVDVDYAMVTSIGRPSYSMMNEEELMSVEFEIEVVF